MMQQDDNQKNLILAIVLSVAVLLGWQFFYAGPKMKEEQERRGRLQQTQTQQTQAPGQPAPGAGTQPGSSAPPVPGAVHPGTTTVTRESALKAAPRVAIETPSLRGSISLKGGRIDDLVLAKYREKVDPTSPNVVLFSPADSPEPYFAEYGWVAPGDTNLKLPDRDTLWQTEGASTLTPEKPVTLVWDNGQGLTFRRTISVDKNYLFSIRDEVENKTAAVVSLFPYARLYRLGTPHVQGFYILHEGLIGVIGDGGLQELSYADALKDGGGKTIDKATGGWLGITDKYWAATLIPDQGAEYRANFSGTKAAGGQKESFQTDYLRTAIVVPASGKAVAEGRLFAGAKEVNIVEGYEQSQGIKKFDRLIDWGWFYFITKPLFHLINWLAGFFSAIGLSAPFGLAILVTTVLVKAAFFPLANKSYESMAKMKKLQPEMERLREQFKDDRARQQQELMALYQKQKINPMAGCLPILLQIPVFFALYKVLFVTIDMRHAPFYGWIKDLSAPDPTSLFNLFGLLPFAPPDFLHVGAWPIIMGITMWVQMQLNPQQPDPIQQKIFNWMPVMFTFMLASFPSGLVIYWAWNNVLSLLQQYTIMRKNGTEVHLWKNLGLEKWMSASKGDSKSLSVGGLLSKRDGKSAGGGASNDNARGGRDRPAKSATKDGA
jgi:YidC/Oxa1 family membrane protein insertase